jgi:hypothetical protein
LSRSANAARPTPRQRGMHAARSETAETGEKTKKKQKKKNLNARARAFFFFCDFFFFFFFFFFLAFFDQEQFNLANI